MDNGDYVPEDDSTTRQGSAEVWYYFLAKVARYLVRKGVKTTHLLFKPPPARRTSVN